MRISDWSSDVCSSDLNRLPLFAVTKTIAGIVELLYPHQSGKHLMAIGPGTFAANQIHGHCRHGRIGGFGRSYGRVEIGGIAAPDLSGTQLPARKEDRKSTRLNSSH